MAKVVTRTLVDDMDGSEAVDTVRFGLDGQDFEIDLSENNAGVLRDIVHDYITAGRETGRSDTGNATTRSSRNREELAAIRVWARSQGLDVKDRGRVPAEVLAKHAASVRAGA